MTGALVMGRLRPDLWVNPQHVVSICPAWGELEPEPRRTEILLVTGAMWTVDGTIDDVARLLGWFEYTVAWPGDGSPVVKVKP